MADGGEAETGSSGTEEAGETGDGDASFLSARFNLFRAILASFRSCFCFIWAYVLPESSSLPTLLRVLENDWLKILATIQENAAMNALGYAWSSKMKPGQGAAALKKPTTKTAKLAKGMQAL